MTGAGHKNVGVEEGMPCSSTLAVKRLYSKVPYVIDCRAQMSGFYVVRTIRTPEQHCGLG